MFQTLFLNVFTVLLLAVTLDWFVSSLLGTKRKLLKPIVNAMHTVASYDTSKIEKELDFTFTPIDQTLERVIKNYKKKS